MSLKYSLVFLTLNEIDGLKHIYKNIPLNQVDEFFAVDGGSTDGTLEFYKKNKVRVINQKSKGRGEAFRIAMKVAKGDVVIFFSPDGNENPEDITKFKQIFEAENPDIVIASRMMKGAVNEEDTEKFKWRKWANNAFNLAINVLFRRNGKYITDSINGFRAIKKTVFKQLDPKSSGYTIEYEMTIKAFKNRLKIVEFPTVESPRIGGESYAKSIPTGIKFLKVLLNEIVTSIFQNKHTLILLAILFFSLFLRFEGIYWNIKGNPDFQYSIHIDEVYKVLNTLSLDIQSNSMQPGEWLMIKGAGYPNLAKILFDIANNNFGKYLFNAVYGYELNTIPGIYLFFRSITAIFSLILIVVTYKLGSLASGNKYAGLIAAFFISTIFGSFYSSIIFKSDIIATTFLTAMLYFVLRYIKYRSSITLYIAAVFLGLAIATKYYSIFAALVFPIIWIVEYIKTKKFARHQYINVIMLTIVSTFILSPYMFLDLQGLKEGLSIQKYYQTTRSYHFEEFGFQLFAIIWHILQISLGPVLTILSLGATIFASYLIFLRKQLLLLPLFVFTSIYFVLSSINTWIVVRYTIPFYPVLCTFVSIMLVVIIKNINKLKNIYKYPFVLLLSLILLHHFLYFLAFSKLIINPTTTVTATAWINDNIKDNESILQTQLLGSEPPIIYGIKNQNLEILTGNEFERFILDGNKPQNLKDYECIIIDERSFIQFYRLKAPKYDVYRNFFNEIKDSKDYKLLKKFENDSSIWGISFKTEFLPQDLQLISPDIYVYQRV